VSRYDPGGGGGENMVLVVRVGHTKTPTHKRQQRKGGVHKTPILKEVGKGKKGFFLGVFSTARFGCFDPPPPLMG